MTTDTAKTPNPTIDDLQWWIDLQGFPGVQDRDCYSTGHVGPALVSNGLPHVVAWWREMPVSRLHLVDVMRVGSGTVQTCMRLSFDSASDAGRATAAIQRFLNGDRVQLRIGSATREWIPVGPYKLAMCVRPQDAGSEFEVIAFYREASTWASITSLNIVRAYCGLSINGADDVASEHPGDVLAGSHAQCRGWTHNLTRTLTSTVKRDAIAAAIGVHRQLTWWEVVLEQDALALSILA